MIGPRRTRERRRMARPAGLATYGDSPGRPQAGGLNAEKRLTHGDHPWSPVTEYGQVGTRSLAVVDDRIRSELFSPVVTHRSPCWLRPSRLTQPPLSSPLQGR